MQLDVLADETPQHRDDVLHDDVEVERARLEDLLAAEGEQLARQRGRPLRGLAHEVEVAAEPVPRIERVRQQRAPADDHGEEVVEVVGDAAGELADRLHLLRLPELLLGGPQGFLRVAPLEELSDLPADIRHDRQELVVLRDGVTVEEHDDPGHLAALDRKRDAAVIAPRGRAVRPHPAQQSFAARHLDVGSLRRRGGPRRRPPQHAELDIHAPELAAIPLERPADHLETAGDREVESVGFREHAGHAEARRAPALGLLALDLAQLERGHRGPEVRRHRVERVHGGRDLRERRLRHPHREIARAEARRAAAERLDRAQAVHEDQVHEGQQHAEQEARGDGDGSNGGPELGLEPVRRGRDGEDRVDTRAGGDLEARLAQIQAEQARQPPRFLGPGVPRRRVEDLVRPVGLVQDDPAPERVVVQVDQDLLGGGEVAHDERVEQQRRAGAGETLGLGREVHVGGAGPVMDLQGCLAHLHGHDREAGQAEEECAEAKPHCPIWR